VHIVRVQRRKLSGGGGLGDIGRRRSNPEVRLIYYLYKLFIACVVNLFVYFNDPEIKIGQKDFYLRDFKSL